MAIYFTTNSDGNDTEGIGAMAQYQIICYTLSKLYDTNFYFTGFKNLTHYQYFNITKEQWVSDIDTFFNFKKSNVLHLPVVKFSDINEPLHEFLIKNDNLIVDFESNTLLQFMNEYIDIFEVETLCQSIADNLILQPDKKYFDNNNTNIAVHIRRFTKTDCDKNPRREYFDENKENYYLELLKKVDEALPNDKNKVYYIYSQGDASDFNFLTQLNLNIQFHIEENPLISLYHMINANVLITSNSSLSYIAHLLGKHEFCMVRDTFFSKWKSKSIKL